MNASQTIGSASRVPMNRTFVRRQPPSRLFRGDPLADLPAPAKRITALYAHVPFCRSRCTYCGFVSTNHHSEFERDNYLELLRRNADYLAARGLFAGRKASLLYIGGGTPTVLSPPELRRLTQWLTGLLPLEDGLEFTCEGHPRSLLGTEGQERLATLVEGGVNRLSLGVQDFVPAVLKVCNRRHTFEEVLEAVQRARDAGVRTINLDFLYGLPGQSPESWHCTLGRALELRPENLTAYRICFKPGTTLARLGEDKFPDEGACDQMRWDAIETLTRAGYVHILANQFAVAGYMFYDEFALPAHTYRYEVENCLPSRDTIGLGVSAYSLLADRRFYNFRSRDEYDRAVIGKESVLAAAFRVSPPEQQVRMLLVGLRRPALGVDKAAFRAHFGCELDQCFEAIIAELVNRGLAQNSPRRFRLTAKGLRRPGSIDEICRPLYEELTGGQIRPLNDNPQLGNQTRKESV